jgi:endonuclease/exonuclease/phosphatase family metal-dependent hydrolase
VIALGVWIQTDFVWAGGVGKADPSFRVVLWNLARPSEADESFIPVLQEADAQILFLVESGGRTMARQHFWRSHFPDYHVRLFAGQMVLLSKYPIAGVRSTAVGEGTRIVECDLVLSGGTLSVVAVDVASVPCSGRRRPLSQIWSVVESKYHPVLVLGDFNTPHTSVLFDELRVTFSHAFEESGAGLIATWPWFFPVLALDHVWLSEGLASTRTVLCRTRHSDHALVIADIAMGSSGEPMQRAP